MLYSHVRKLRQISIYHKARFHVFFESNMSHISAGDYEKLLVRPELQPIAFHRSMQNKQLRVGVHTSEQDKHDYAEELRDCLRRDRLSYVEPHAFVSERPQAMCALLESQIKSYRYVYHTDAQGRTKRTLTGKGSKNQKDDVVVTLQLNLHESARIRPILVFPRKPYA